MGLKNTKHQKIYKNNKNNHHHECQSSPNESPLPFDGRISTIVKKQEQQIFEKQQQQQQQWRRCKIRVHDIYKWFCSAQPPSPQQQYGVRRGTGLVNSGDAIATIAATNVEFERIIL